MLRDIRSRVRVDEGVVGVSGEGRGRWCCVEFGW